MITQVPKSSLTEHFILHLNNDGWSFLSTNDQSVILFLCATCLVLGYWGRTTIVALMFIYFHLVFILMVSFFSWHSRSSHHNTFSALFGCLFTWDISDFAFVLLLPRLLILNKVIEIDLFDLHGWYPFLIFYFFAQHQVANGKFYVLM